MAAREKPDPIERGFFRTTPDGATVFFPWGLTGRGYRLADAGAKRKAARAASLLMASVVAVGTWGGEALHRAFGSGAPAPDGIARVLAAPAAVLALVLVAYGAWASHFVEGCTPSDLRVSREERLREAAQLGAPRKLVAVGAVLAGLSALLAWLQPEAWWLGALGVVLGAALAFGALALERAAARG